MSPPPSEIGIWSFLGKEQIAENMSPTLIVRPHPEQNKLFEGNNKFQKPVRHSVLPTTPSEIGYGLRNAKSRLMIIMVLY